MQYAAKNGHEAVVWVLLEHNLNVNLKNLSGRTPLQGAVRNGHEAIVLLLLEHSSFSSIHLSKEVNLLS
jgi:ankyrin repeat protein